MNSLSIYNFCINYVINRDYCGRSKRDIIVKLPRSYGGESYADRAGPLENIRVCSEAWSCIATTADCLVFSDGAHQTRNSYKLRCLVFCSWGHFQNVGVNMEAG